MTMVHTSRPQGRGGKLRVALYSHDALGLGHVRRNLAIAHSLAAMDPSPDILLLTGAPGAADASRPEGCDIVSLPALAKDTDGVYAARHLSLDESAVVGMRRSILTAALESFLPDVLIVDKHPRGFRGELEPALQILKEAGTRIVLGLRDILDDAVTSRREWKAARSSDAVQRWYDQVWVYGDRNIHDLARELGLSENHTVHTGYLASGRVEERSIPEAPAPYVLAMMGGGSDGEDLARTFVQTRLPAGHHGVLVTGPQMDAEHVATIRQMAAHRTDITIHTWVDNAETLLAGAAAVVAMGGYNTVCEAMALGSNLLVVPRVTPRQEQLVRARLLTDAGQLDHMLSDDVSPDSLGAWLFRAVQPPLTTPRPRTAKGRAVDLNGLARLPQLLTNLSKEPAYVA